MIRRIGGKGPEEEEEEKGEEEKLEDPRTKMRRDHGLDFGLFNTMLAGC